MPPAKRRKTDSTAASPAPKANAKQKAKASGPQVRTLEYFFKKQQESAVAESTTEAEVAPSSPAAESDVPESSAKTQEERDEEFARQLAAQWAEEDAAANSKANGGQSLKRARSESPSVEAGPSGSREKLKTPEVIALPTPKRAAVSVEDEKTIEKVIEEIAFDQDPLTFDPDALHELKDRWPDGTATYSLLTRAFVLINSTKSRIKIVDTLVNFLRTLIRLDPASLLPAVWLTTNDIGPSYENNDLGIGGSIITKAIQNTSGITPAALRKLYHKYGDPGDVAFDAKSRQRTLMMRKPTPLTVKRVYETLVKISKLAGKGSQETKQGLVERMLIDAKKEEIRYLTRTLIQHLRIGAVKTTMLIALSRAFLLSKPQDSEWDLAEIPKAKERRQEMFAKAEGVVKQCFAKRPNYNDLVPALLSGGLEVVETLCPMALHIPLKPMLGSITRDLEEMLEKLQDREFACEYKYDGQRAQVHCDPQGNVSIFSRHLDLMTDKYPDLVALVPQFRGEGVESFILEGEVVAVDREFGEIKPFQTLAGRDRRNVEIETISVNVCLFAFDLMYLNGQELLKRSFRERRELLRSMFTEIPSHFTWVKSLDAVSTDVAECRDFFSSALAARCEGIMVKVLDNIAQPPALTTEEEAALAAKAKGKKKPTKTKNSKTSANNNGTPNTRRKALLSTYEPDKRLESWLKVKKDYNTTADTLDLVPIGAWHGSGRKVAWWSPILLAVRNPDTGSFIAVCKCMSGFTDKFYAEMKEFYSEEGINTSYEQKPFYESALQPTVWFEPNQVWEVAFADVTVSPTYTAALGLVDEERGLSLRFPRFLRKREDKTVEEASTARFLADLYWKQEQGPAKAVGKVEEDGKMEEGDEKIEEEDEKMEEEEAGHVGEVDGEQGGDGNDATIADDE